MLIISAQPLSGRHGAKEQPAAACLVVRQEGHCVPRFARLGRFHCGEAHHAHLAPAAPAQGPGGAQGLHTRRTSSALKYGWLRPWPLHAPAHQGGAHLRGSCSMAKSCTMPSSAGSLEVSRLQESTGMPCSVRLPRKWPRICTPLSNSAPQGGHAAHPQGERQWCRRHGGRHGGGRLGNAAAERPRWCA